MSAQDDLLCLNQKNSRKMENTRTENKSRKILIFKGVELHIQNIDDELSTEILQREFEHFGQILSIEIKTTTQCNSMHENTENTFLESKLSSSPDAKAKTEDLTSKKKTKKYAIVYFLSPADAARALHCMNGCILMKNVLYVTSAGDKIKRRRPSPSPLLQTQYTMGLITNGSLWTKRRLSIQEDILHHPKMITSSPTSTGSSLIQFKRKISSAQSVC